MTTTELIRGLRAWAVAFRSAGNHECLVLDLEDAADRLEEQNERIAIMRESMEAIERRLTAAECQPIEIKSTDQMVYVGWMHEDQKLGLSEEEENAEKSL